MVNQERDQIYKWIVLFKIVMGVATCIMCVAERMAKSGLSMSEWVMEHPKFLRAKELRDKL